MTHIPLTLGEYRTAADADLDSAALARPKVAAMIAALRGIAAMKDYHSPRAQDQDRAADALAALEASHE